MNHFRMLHKRNIMNKKTSETMMAATHWSDVRRQCPGMGPDIFVVLAYIHTPSL